MSKLAWISTFAALVVAAGGSVYYFVQHKQVEAPVPITPTPQPTIIPVPPAKDDDLQRRKLEGIGSTRNLKPVPIPQGNAR